MNRWFDPGTGKWLSDDPISFAAGDANLKRYVGNEVLNSVDFTGLLQTPAQQTETDVQDGKKPKPTTVTPGNDNRIVNVASFGVVVVLISNANHVDRPDIMTTEEMKKQWEPHITRGEVDVLIPDLENWEGATQVFDKEKLAGTVDLLYLDGHGISGGNWTKDPSDGDISFVTITKLLGSTEPSEVARGEEILEDLKNVLSPDGAIVVGGCSSCGGEEAVAALSEAATLVGKPIVSSTGNVGRNPAFPDYVITNGVWQIFRPGDANRER